MLNWLKNLFKSNNSLPRGDETIKELLKLFEEQFRK